MGGLLQSLTAPKSLLLSPSNTWNHPILNDNEAPGKLGPQVPYVSAKVRGYTYVGHHCPNCAQFNKLSTLAHLKPEWPIIAGG